MKYKINISSKRNVWRNLVDLKSNCITCSDVKCEVVDNCDTCIFANEDHLLKELENLGRIQQGR